ncbi:MAG: hypothetical protein MMC33_005470 [Icmadophila ericetorum]|nr:hypothetical protein [Icmadophila ericetorum]
MQTPSLVRPLTTSSTDSTTPSDSKTTLTSSVRPSSTSSTPLEPTIDKQGAHPRPTFRRRGLSSIALPSPTNRASDNANWTERPRTSPSSSRIDSPLRTSPTRSYFSPQPGASGSKSGTPVLKRPPASRSSHGINNHHGPPPALSTQRTYSTENAWRISPSRDFAPLYPQLTPGALATLDAENRISGQKFDLAILEARMVAEGNTGGESSEAKGSVNKGLKGAEDTSGTISTATQSRPSLIPDQVKEKTQAAAVSDGNLKFLTVTDMSSIGDGQRRKANSERQSLSSQEDLFLNLANTDTKPMKAADTTDNRRAPETLSQRRPSLPRTGDLNSSTSATRSREDSNNMALVDNGSERRRTQQSVVNSPLSRTTVGSRDRQYAASAHPLDQRYTPRFSNGTPKSTSRGGISVGTTPESPQPYERRTSIQESNLGLPSRPYRQSNLSQTRASQYNSSPLTGRTSRNEVEPISYAPLQEGTESTVSTTAPSTVWDELDDLKSRIKKLELTGKLPSSSGAAIQTATSERPPTATTTVTTMSLSPKYDRAGTFDSPEASGGQDVVNPHPLLTSALTNSKSLLSPPKYRALEAAVTDAIELAKIANANGKRGTMVSAADRQLKRKADNTCRSLTELCIALTEDQTESTIERRASRPGSRNTNYLRTRRDESMEDPRFRRAMSLDPDPTSTSKVLSRLEARRSSMLGISANNNNNSSSIERYQEVATPTQPTPTAISYNLNRTSTSLAHARRTTAAADGNDDNTEQTIRPLSRAMTELNHGPTRIALHQLRPRDRDQQQDRERPHSYLQSNSSSNSDQQQQQQQQSSLPVRRSYLFTPSHFPVTPMHSTIIQPGSRRYLERSSERQTVLVNQAEATSSRLAEARQQRLASMGQLGHGLNRYGHQRRSSLGRRGVGNVLDLTVGDDGGQGER